jgi:hypothetical protein
MRTALLAILALAAAGNPLVGLAAAPSAVPEDAHASLRSLLVGKWTDNGDCSRVTEILPGGWLISPDGSRGLWYLDGTQLMVGATNYRVHTLTSSVLELEAVDGRRGTSARCSMRGQKEHAAQSIFPSPPNMLTTPTDVAPLPPTAPSAAAPVPTAMASCKGSVKRGLKAFNAGDHDAALCYWLPKAQAGDAAAQNNMGVLFESGTSTYTPQSDEEAANWFALSARQGFVLAMRNLAKVQQRLGHWDAAQSWLARADGVEAEQRARNQQGLQEGLAALGYAIGCAAAGGCSATPPASVSVVPTQRSGPSGMGTASIGGSSSITMCPSGSYVSGSTCTMAPDGTYVAGSPRLAPDGSYVAGTPRITPSGSFVGGTGRIILCPDGTYVSGTSCRLTPAGTYVGN